MDAPQDDLAIITADLKPQERAFCDHFLSDPNMSIAAAVRAAGYSVSDRGAAAFGEGILKNRPVQRYIAWVHAERRDRHRDIRDGCLQALWQLAAGWDIKDLIGQLTTKDSEYGEIQERGVLPPDELPAPLRAAIKSVNFAKGRWSYTFVDKSQILMLLLKHFGELDKLQAPPPLDATPKVKVWQGDDDE
jgi:hypothetical protein